MDKIILDKGKIRTLASETRVDILKKLDSEHMTLKKLCDELNLPKPTIHENLTVLVESGLVRKKNIDSKWVYYVLTEEGRGILHSGKNQKKIIILLSSAILSFIAGIVEIYQVVRSIFLPKGVPEAEHLIIGLILILLGFLLLHLLNRSVRGVATRKTDI
jgi:DNA-binding transcriptional ArsR family regulator